MKILFLHGKESGPGGKKPTYLAEHGFTVINPALPKDDFEASVRIAQAAFDEHTPDAVVGSSRGGAVAMNINIGDAGLVLLAPAWKKWGNAKTVKPQTRVIHSRHDDIVLFASSEELVASSPSTVLVEIGSDHRLSTPEPLAAMFDAVRTVASVALADGTRPEQLDHPPGDKVEFLIGVTRDEREEIPFASVGLDGGRAYFDAAGNRLPAGRVFAWDWSPKMSRADWLKKVEVGEREITRLFGPDSNDAPLASPSLEISAAESSASVATEEQGSKGNRPGGVCDAEIKRGSEMARPMPRSNGGGPTP